MPLTLRLNLGTGIVASPKGEEKLPVESSTKYRAGTALSAKSEADALVFATGAKNAASALETQERAHEGAEALYDILGKLQEYATKAASYVTSQPQRDYLDSEARILVSEYSRIVSSTEFNGRRLLADSSGISVNFGPQNSNISGVDASQDLSAVSMSNASAAALTYSISTNARYTLNTKEAVISGNEFRLGSAIHVLQSAREAHQAQAENLKEPAKEELTSQKFKEALGSLLTHPPTTSPVTELLGTKAGRREYEKHTRDPEREEKKKPVLVISEG